jgi:hypothetical protein
VFNESLNRVFPRGSGGSAVVNVLEELLPALVYFSNDERMPGEVPIEALVAKGPNLEMSERIFLAVLAMVGTTPAAIQSLRRFEPLLAELEGVSNRLTGEIFTYWTQNRHLQVQIQIRRRSARRSPAPQFGTDL